MTGNALPEVTKDCFFCSSSKVVSPLEVHIEQVDKWPLKTSFPIAESASFPWTNTVALWSEMLSLSTKPTKEFTSWKKHNLTQDSEYKVEGTRQEVFSPLCDTYTPPPTGVPRLPVMLSVALMCSKRKESGVSDTPWYSGFIRTMPWSEVG